jgi:hypothetical protein
MPVLERTYGRPAAGSINELMISADSHVIEPEALWQRELASQFAERAHRRSAAGVAATIPVEWTGSSGSTR